VNRLTLTNIDEGKFVTGTPEQLRNINKWIITLTVMLPTMIEIIDTSVANVALDHIRGALSAGLDEATWVLTSYLVSNAIVIPMTGWLSATFGRRRYLIFSISLFAFASFMCGAAWSLQSLVFFRVLQGIGGGGLQPLSQAILFEAFPAAEHGMAMAVFGIGVVMGPILGPVMGGWITDNMSWRWIFYINIPICLLSVLLTSLFIYDPPYLKRIKQRVDYIGLSLLVVGLGALQIVLDKGERESWFDSSFILYLSALAALCLISFVIVELTSEHPVVDLRVFRHRFFAAGNLIMFFGFFGFFGSIVLLPMYLQSLMGYTAYLAGLVLGPGGLATLIAMPVAGILIGRIDSRWILGCGLLLNAYALHLMAGFNLNADFWTIIWPRIIQGVAIGFFFVPLATLTISSLPRPEMGNATAIFNLIRNLGGSFGVAIVTTFLSRRAQFHQARLAEHINPLSAPYRHGMAQLQQALPAVGDEGSLQMLYGYVQQQAHMLSFNDCFAAVAVLFVALVPLLFILKRTRGAPAAGAH
jgi:DHA2 family multidrug resistance protein